MKPLAKFLFDTSFDADDAPEPAPAAPETEAAPAPPPPLPIYGEEDLAKARQEGRAQGRAEAEAAVRNSIEQSAGAALTTMAEKLPGLARQLEDGLRANVRLMLETALAGLRRMVPELNRRGGLAEVEGLLEQTVANLRDESRIVVRLNEQLLDGLRGRLDRVAQSSGFEGRFVLLADDEIPAGDCRIEWADGGVERMASRVWSDIEAAVMRALAASSGAAEAKDTLATSMGAGQPQEI